MIEIEFFRVLTDRQPHQHSVQSLDRLLLWSTTNEVLKNNTLLYRKWLTDNPFATKERKSKAKIFYFPTVTFSGTFTGTAKATDIKDMSGLIVLDFDHVLKFNEVRLKLENDCNTFLLFVSPSGDGLKVIVKHNLTDPLKWQCLYFELEKYYLELLLNYQDTNGAQLGTDKSGKDINRMCFLPFIDSLFQNDNSTVWQYQGTFEKSKLPQGELAKKSNIIRELSQPDTTNNLFTECFYLSSYLFENRINITEDYEDWLSYGYSLCTLGEQGREIFHNISCISDKYNPDTLNTKYDYLLKNYDCEKTGIDNFLNNAKKAIAHHVIINKYGFQCQ